MEALLQTLQYIEDEVSYIVTKTLLADLSETDALQCLEAVYADNIVNAIKTIDDIVKTYCDKMSDSDDSSPIDRTSTIKGVPIFFGKSPSVKRLMQQIKEHGLVYPESMINTSTDIPGVVDVRDADEEDEPPEEVDVKEELFDNDADEETYIEDGPVVDVQDAQKSKVNKTKSKRKQGSPKKKQSPIKIKLKLPVQEKNEENEEAGTSTKTTRTPTKKKRIRKPPGAKREGFKYTCEQCQQGFNGKIPLAKHYRDAHFVTKPFKCNECEKTFASIRTLNDHKVVNHTEKSANICEICGKSFSSPTYLKVHERVHTGERPFTCDQCAMAFKDCSTLRNHYKAIHTSVNENEEYVCDICGKSFHYQRYLLNHKKRLHVDGKAHQCTECGKMFRLKQTLVEHMEIHIKKDYMCAECGKHFSHYRSYRRHEKAHKETERFSCPMCGKSYKNKKSAEPHMKACKQKDHTSSTNAVRLPERENTAIMVQWPNALKSAEPRMKMDSREDHPSTSSSTVDISNREAAHNAAIIMQWPNAFPYNM